VPLLLLALVLPVPAAIVATNVLLLLVRLGLLAAVAGSYEQRGVPYVLSWLADPAAVWRVAASSARRPVSWRGRDYRELA